MDEAIMYNQTNNRCQIENKINIESFFGENCCLSSVS